jgi:electron transport complex protein RnfG
MRELLKLTVILTIICVVAATALALTYNLTKEPIAYQKRLKTIRAVNAVFTKYGDTAGLQLVGIPFCEDETAQKSCRTFYQVKHNDEIIGTAFKVFRSGYGGPLVIMVGVDSTDTISGIQVVSHSETPGLGANITKETFYSQFAGVQAGASEWKLRKNGGEIDQVSGATISSTAAMQAVYTGVRFFMQNSQNIIAPSEGS